MKLAFFAAAMMLGGSAFAQTTNTTTTTDQTSMSTTTMPSGTPVAPGNSSPERDARGIPVVSDSATAPPGWNQVPGSGAPVADASTPAAPQGEAGPLPPCSRKVTDHCTQTYERGARPRG